MDFRCAVALFGHMGVEADVRKLEIGERASLARWIALYKEWRGVLHSGAFHQGKTVNGVWWLVQTPKRCILGVFTTQAPSTQHHAPLRLPMVTGDSDWRLRLIGRAGLERARPGRHRLDGGTAGEWTGVVGVRIAGAWFTAAEYEP